MTRPRRILFVSENVTLAQVVRLVTLAKSLPTTEYEVHFACSAFDPIRFAGTTFRRWPISSLKPDVVARAVADGKRIYELDTLAMYVDEERRLFDRVQPDVVVGDLRHSLAVSAPLAGVPCVSLINAYWSRDVVRATFPLPEHPIVRLLGVEKAARYFPMALPRVLEHFARPINALRKRHRLSPLGDLQDILLWGDRTIFPDVPGLVPLLRMPASQRFLGPVLWSPDVPLPTWWSELTDDRPLVYVTLGSSGDLAVLPTVLGALERLDVDVLLATADRWAAASLPANVRAVPFVPGHLAARRAALVVSNGGSSTGYQALHEGTPVLGIPANLDQYLAMTAIADAGAGVLLRSGTLTRGGVSHAVRGILGTPRYRTRARELAAEMAAHDAASEFRATLAELLPARRNAAE